MAVRRHRGVICGVVWPLHDAPGAVAGSSGELARQGTSELRQHQADGFGALNAPCELRMRWRHSSLGCVSHLAYLVRMIQNPS
jgi:hypothetical protein